MPALKPALDAQIEVTDSRAGRVSYYVAGDGPPLLLIHSINAAGSAYEVKPIFDRYRGSRRVYVPDLPGFGLSDRSPRDYTIRLYVDAVQDMLEAITSDSGQTKIDALALSLSCEFLARAATEAPSRLRTLALITPTGFRKGSERLRGPDESTREMRLLASIVDVPLWRRALFKGLVNPRVVRYFLRRTWGSANIDEDLAAYDDLTTHQPGAEHAPLAFLSGRLFSGDIRNLYERLELPVWLAHGTRGDFKDFSEAGWAKQRDNWRVQAFNSGALPHFERPNEFFPAYDAFLDDTAAP
jgi:pimeloyl-ACP methyl ester carboxylesterase